MTDTPLPFPLDTPLPLLGLTTAEARRLAGILSVRNDLSFALDCTQRLIDSDQKQSVETAPDGVALRAYFDAMLVAYGRCFKEGRRERLDPDDARRLGEGADQFHAAIVGLRDRLIAHAVDPFEDVMVGILAVPGPGNGVTVHGSGHFSARLSGWPADTLRDFMRLVAAWIGLVVDPQVKAMSEQLLEAACRMTRNELEALRPVTYTAVAIASAARPRRPRRSKRSKCGS